MQYKFFRIVIGKSYWSGSGATGLTRYGYRAMTFKTKHEAKELAIKLMSANDNEWSKKDVRIYGEIHDESAPGGIVVVDEKVEIQKHKVMLHSDEIKSIRMAIDLVLSDPISESLAWTKSLGIISKKLLEQIKDDVDK